MSLVFKEDKVGIFHAEKDLIPKRATEGSAGYDFFCPETTTIPAHGIIRFKSNVKVTIREGYVLLLYIRSSLGIKHQITLTNGTGVIDSDFKEEITAALKNDSDDDFVLQKGERYMQGVFVRHYYAENDSVIGKSRKGGIGSTGK